MIIIPFDKKLDWKNPPIITLFLIFVNILIYFSFQLNDDEKFHQIEHYYHQSGLAEIELPLYKEQLKKQNKLHPQNVNPSFFDLEFDRSFMQALERKEVITTSNPVYNEWILKRNNLTQMKESIVSWQFSFQTGAPTLITLISHMFLHAGFSHLWGNMLFLLAVGFIVELSMNRSTFLIAYLLSGALSVLITIPSGIDSLVISLGASGAIAGLMGMYAILFNTRKVRFFYFIYVYFDYVKLPAIYLLVLWLGFQLFQQFNYSDISNVNYLAHIGGLISGAVIAFIISKTKHPNLNYSYLNERSINEDFNRSLNQANSLVNELEYEKAAPIFAELLDKRPKHREVLYGYYRTNKLSVGSQPHHHGVAKILSLTDRDEATDKLVLDVFDEYSKLQSPRYTISILNNLIRRFTTRDAFEQAEKVISIMQKQSDKFPQLPDHIASLINKLNKKNELDKAKAYSHYLNEKYPHHQATLFINHVSSIK